MKWIGSSTVPSSPAGLKTHSIDTFRDQPLPARICFIADAFRCRNIRPNRTSGARRSSIKMDVSLRNRHTRTCVRLFFLFFFNSPFSVCNGESRVRDVLAICRVKAEFFNITGQQDEMNRWVRDERTSRRREFMGIFSSYFEASV